MDAKSCANCRVFHRNFGKNIFRKMLAKKWDNIKKENNIEISSEPRDRRGDFFPNIKISFSTMKGEFRAMGRPSMLGRAFQITLALKF